MKKVLLTIIIFAMLGIGVLFTILPVWMLLLSWTLISVLAELAIFASSTKMIRSK